MGPGSQLHNLQFLLPIFATAQAFDVHQVAVHRPAITVLEENFPQTLASSHGRFDRSRDKRSDSFSTIICVSISFLQCTSWKIYGHLVFPMDWHKSLCSDDSTSEVSWKGTSHHFRFVMIATKGDWPFLRSAYSLNCGFNCRDKCHRCDVREPYQKNSHFFICLNFGTVDKHMNIA